jgi:hypothetical protein
MLMRYCMSCLFVWGCLVSTVQAEELPAPTVNPVVVTETQPPPSPMPDHAEPWRISRYHEQWWYYTPAKTWKYWDNKSWVDYDPVTYRKPAAYYAKQAESQSAPVVIQTQPTRIVTEHQHVHQSSPVIYQQPAMVYQPAPVQRVYVPVPITTRPSYGYAPTSSGRVNVGIGVGSPAVYGPAFGPSYGPGYYGGRGSSGITIGFGF